MVIMKKWFFLRIFCALMGIWTIYYLYINHKFVLLDNSPLVFVLFSIGIFIIIYAIFSLIYIWAGIENNPFKKDKAKVKEKSNSSH